MPLRHTALACLVAALWGINFLAIHASLEQFPPIFLVALRFAILAVPALLLVPRPQVPTRWLIGYGLGFGTIQFFGLYLGMAAGFPTGLASLVLQASAPFTVVLGVLFLREPMTRRRAVSVGVAVLGLALVGLSRGSAESWWPFWLVVLGAFGWAIGNLSSRLAAPPKPLHLIMWMTVVPPLPMLALSLVIEGPDQILEAWSTAATAAAAPAWIGLAYTVVLGTVVGSGIWVWLMKRHPAGVVAPFSMLVPVVGITAAWLVLGETPSALEVAGGVLVVVGVLWGNRVRPRSTTVPSTAAAPTPAPSAPAPSAPAPSAPDALVSPGAGRSRPASPAAG
ncbi:EamA family transporter [Actinotalea sp. C106]|uniref:EamA family transporter n=1 Tax=Actinotalea sp. C106 TaxID=2908644 RepID=UPI002028D48D|nr:EamA family transporter [Actinotalea sp. C106]